MSLGEVAAAVGGVFDVPSDFASFGDDCEEESREGLAALLRWLSIVPRWVRTVVCTGRQCQKGS